jgi:hypothetical protein
MKLTAQLPLGCQATFSMSPDGLTVEWSPGVPHIREPPHRRKFLSAYDTARNNFLADVATIKGSPIVVADLTGSITIIKPGARH